jgi:hypothetical protein
MNSGLLKTIIGLFLLSIILFFAGIVLFKTFFPLWYFSFFPVLVAIFFLINSGFFVSFYRTVSRPHNQFVRGFMLSKVIKLMIYLLLVLIYVLLSPKSAVPFAVTLSVLYVAYTAYDLYVMVNLVKRKKEITTLPN